MPFNANIWCYLWDLEAEGIDRALDVIQGELGATGLSVAAVYHSVDELRPHDGVSPRWFRSAGGLHFQPDAARYRGTRARPAVAEWLKTRNPLERLSAACEKRGLALRAWVVCCHSSAMAARNPALATKDVFGASSETWLCPLNPDVQEYLRAVVEDLTHTYRVAAVELEACGFPGGYHTHKHEKIGFAPGPVGRLLLALCVCESCRQLAARDGIDVAAVERSATVDLEEILRNGAEPDRREPGGGVGKYLTKRKPLEAFITWRSGRVAALVGQLRTACSGGLMALRSGEPLMTGAGPRQVAAQCDGLIAQAYRADEDALERIAKQTAEETGSPGRVILGLDACPGFAKDAASLVRNVGRAAALGVAGVNFYNYGMIPPARLDWVKQAIRYGRREA
jgi:hypothetical protein